MSILFFRGSRFSGCQNHRGKHWPCSYHCFHLHCLEGELDLSPSFSPNIHRTHEGICSTRAELFQVILQIMCVYVLERGRARESEREHSGEQKENLLSIIIGLLFIRAPFFWLLSPLAFQNIHTGFK